MTDVFNFIEEFCVRAWNRLYKYLCDLMDDNEKEDSEGLRLE